MKKTISILLVMLLTMILGMIITHKVGYQKGVSSAERKIERDTIWKRYDSAIFIPTPIPVSIWREPHSEPADIDTVAIISDYYSKKVYSEKIEVDSLLRIHITDTLSRNGLLGRQINYSFNIPTVTIRQKKPNLTISVIGDSRYYAGTQIGWKRVLFNAGYDFKDRFPVIGVGLKIYER